jgi:hypothetical protein
MAPQPSRETVVTILTGVVVVLWLAVTIARIWVEIPQATILDAAMPLVIGFWFSSQAMKPGNGTTKEPA